MMPIFEEIKQYQENRRKIEEKYNKEIFDQNLQEIYQSLTKKYRFFWRIGSPKYYGIKKIFKTCSIEKKSFSYLELVSETNKILTNINLKEEIKSVPIETTSPLGELWQDVETEINIVLFALEWLKKYQTSRVIEDDDDNLKKFILNSEAIPKYLLDLKSTIENNIKELKKKKTLIDCALKIDNETVYPLGFDNTSIEHIHFLIETMHDNIHVLVDWTRYQRALKECGIFNLMKYIDEIILKKFEPNNLIIKFKRSFLFQLLQIIFKQCPQLETFESLTHNQIIKKFQKLDKSQFKLAQYRIKESLYNRKPDMNWEGTRNSKLGYLQRQFRLRRGIHPIRKIFSNVPDIVQKICPCFMMSPLSLAQYITPGVMEFDIVIFDEASQIEPENSLGAIIRGHQLVVAGDTKQLPPSAFFQKEILIAEDDEYSDELNTPPLESILDECLTIGMKSFTLKWHYRSKHESLIHFSNKSFYKNELLTFPSPYPNSKDLGVYFVHVQDAIYERGGSGVNRKEAKEVAKAVLNHFRNNPKKSLGVGTFSIKQQIAIVDELDNLRRQDLSLETFFTNSVNEPFFIKNLETIQGDERDVIFISVGYGKDANGKLSMHFGPLNKEGGERRLNVLITRAKEKIIVFSSITGDDFDLSKTQSIGIYKLKQYLDFAKLKRFDEDIDISCDFDENNPFECSVYKQLKAKGIKAIPQVGFAGYKIDFGILHPNNSSKFILAVECDGANYHSSATARDRDRLRQEILEKKGWHFHRIWSTDWFLNPSSEMQRLLQAIEIAKKFSPSHFEDETPEIEIEQMDTDPSKNNFGIEIIPYQKYSISHMGGPDSFYSSFYKIKELILKIIKIESPIHIKELALRVIQHFEMNKVGNKINNKIKFFIEQMCNEHAVLYKNSFVYQINSPINIIRRRDCEDAITNIEFIPPEEITNAIMLVVKKEFSISLEELIPKTARLFGFQHTGKKIQNYIKNDIRRLVKEKLLVESEYGIKENQQK